MTAVIVTDRAVAAKLATSAGRLGLHARFVDALIDAPAAVEDHDPELIVVDGSLVGRDEVALQATFAGTSGLRVLVAPVTTGEWINLAARTDADAVSAAPLDESLLARMLADVARGRRRGQGEAISLPVFVDQSDRMRDVWRLVTVASRSEASVVVVGETGVGKEGVARALHRFSPRRHGPFIAINCAALPETLLESELFGHEKGSFTGASAQRKGRFELADGGTLMLDEVGELPLSLQVKLLRVLQERCFERVGGTRTISVDVRVISATHRDLEDEVRRGRFRADLYYRIRVLSIPVPPLRRRNEDVLPLWDHFVADRAGREGRGPPTTSMAACRRLLRHEWPGNVRELQNAAEHAVALVGSGAIMPADLPELGSGRGGGEELPSLVGMTLHEIERLAIVQTYAAMGTIKAASEALGVSERKLHYRLKEYREQGSQALRMQVSALSGTAADGEEPSPEHPRVLLAEDDDELRWTLRDFLQCAGYQVVAVRDGRALLEHIGAATLLEHHHSPADAIITDIRMPFLTGLQLLQQLRQSGWTMPVVIMSAFGDDELRSRADALGAAAFLDKPIDTEALLRVLRSVVH